MLVVVFDPNLDDHNTAVKEPFIQPYQQDGGVIDQGLSSCEYREFEHVFEKAFEKQAVRQRQAVRQAVRQAFGQAFQ